MNHLDVTNQAQENSTPLVSVHMITYNHERYISRAIEGVLMQKTNFIIELIIGEDFSKDSTRSICEKFAKQFPEIIQLLPSIQNLGMEANSIRTLKACKSKYVATCEGDDFWTDPYKLQKQVDFLETNSEYAMVSTDIYLVDKEDNYLPDNSMVLRQKVQHKSEITFFDLLEINLINTLTVCIRNEIMQKLVFDIVNRDLSFIIDKWYWLNIAMDHKIRAIPDKTAAYRVHTDGMSSNTEFMDSRMPLIRHDVIRKYILNHDLHSLNESDLKILTKSCFNLLLFKNLSIKKRFNILWLVITHPLLLKNSTNFITGGIRKKISRK